MKARLIENEGKMTLLCFDGSIIEEPENEVILDLFYNFKNVEEIKGTDGIWNNGCDITEVPGTTIAFVNDYNNLTLIDSAVFVRVLSGDITYISAMEYAKKHNKSVEIIKVYLREGRIYGAKKIGKAWAIPEDAPYPVPKIRDVFRNGPDVPNINQDINDLILGDKL